MKEFKFVFVKVNCFLFLPICRTSLNSATCFWENMEKTLDPLRLALRLPRLLALAEPDSFGVPVGVGAFSSAGAGSGSGAGAASSFFLVFFFFSLSA